MARGSNCGGQLIKTAWSWTSWYSRTGIRPPPSGFTASCSRGCSTSHGSRSPISSELRGSESRAAARSRASPAQGAQQPRRELASAHPRAEAADAPLQIARPRSEIFIGPWHHCVSLPSWPAPVAGVGLPSADGPPLPDVAGSDGGRRLDA